MARTGDEPVDTAPAPRRRRAARLVQLCAGLVLIAGALGLGAAAVRPILMSHQNTAALPPLNLPATDVSVAPPPPPTSPASSASPSASPAPVGLPHAVPATVDIPRVGIHARVTSVGLTDTGSVQVPKDTSVAGWYSGGPAPGDTDTDMPAIVVGHVDSYRGPAVFYQLRQVRPGDKVSIRRDDGSTATFVVYRVAEYLKSAFPDSEVYGPTSHPELRLITCSGTFDRTTRSYLSDFVAYAVLWRSSAPQQSPTAEPSPTPALPHRPAE